MHFFLFIFSASDFGSVGFRIELLKPTILQAKNGALLPYRVLLNLIPLMSGNITNLWTLIFASKMFLIFADVYQRLEAHAEH